MAENPLKTLKRAVYGEKSVKKPEYAPEPSKNGDFEPYKTAATYEAFKKAIHSGNLKFDFAHIGPDAKWLASAEPLPHEPEPPEASKYALGKIAEQVEKLAVPKLDFPVVKGALAATNSSIPVPTFPQWAWSTQYDDTVPHYIQEMIKAIDAMQKEMRILIKRVRAYQAEIKAIKLKLEEKE